MNARGEVSDSSMKQSPGFGVTINSGSIALKTFVDIWISTLTISAVAYEDWRRRKRMVCSRLCLRCLAKQSGEVLIDLRALHERRRKIVHKKVKRKGDES